MSKVLTALGFAMILAGIFIAFLPDLFFSAFDWDSRSGQLSAAGIRVVAGLVFLFGASATRYPAGFRILGVVVLAAGAAIALAPAELWAALLQLVTSDYLSLTRFGAAIGGPLLGGFIVHAARPTQPEPLAATSPDA
ncbi:MAG: hypothetical protein HKN72_16930 [Gemmatimonadetes bacterium]|nr:hypothetical protein [Gemmatimonadota bacterium]NNF14915.1 hypothetical protein [Gemmatimonadota bacterium]NNL30648.1 hypothetical protein [Gemmatimonadota bacterium]